MLSPSLFAILSGISLIGAALLFVMGKYGGAEIPAQTGKLSDLEPSEYRVAAYLALVSGWGVAGLVLTLIAGVTGAGSVCGLILIVLASLCLVVLLCFLYAAGCTLLHTLVGRTDGPVAWFFPATRHIDSVIVWFGDLLLSSIYAKTSQPSVARRARGSGRGMLRAVARAPHAEGQMNAADAMARIESILAEYEAGLSGEQRKKLESLRRVVQELGDVYL